MKAIIKNYIYITLGSFFLVLGFIGLFLPIVPTTPFILVSVWFFARSSNKLENWLVNHKIFGKMIQDWRNHGSINKKAKISATLLIIFSFSGAIYFNQILVFDILLAVVGTSIVVFIISRPDYPEIA
tara:strand:- start:2841 stop:3221 length:381 start_codon:yes stop_codon:yes gene_type:complete